MVYLHYGFLYLAGAWVLYGEGFFPATRGPAWVWFAAGAAIGAVVVGGLWWWQSPWFARAVWLLVALRLPTLIEGAFGSGGIEGVPQLAYVAAGLAVLVNLWALARAAWDV